MDFERPRRRQRAIELTPLIDVVFLLLVFLILTANFQQPSLELDLPGGASDDASVERAVLRGREVIAALAFAHEHTIRGCRAPPVYTLGAVGAFIRPELPECFSGSMPFPAMYTMGEGACNTSGLHEQRRHAAGQIMSVMFRYIHIICGPC